MISQITAAYIHIPFCRRRCYYCDFPITVVGDGGGKLNLEPMMEQYVQIVCREIALTARWFPSSGLKTVFFGGGTPSLLPIHQLETILVTLDYYFSFTKDAEVSIEIDPGTFDFPQIKAYQRLGINRYSLGIQAFQDDLLAQMGRTHRLRDINWAMTQLQKAGVENFSFDLISGLPHQTLEQWETTLEAAIALSPPHLSCYDLIVEPGTAFDHYAQTGNLPLPPDETSAEMYRLAQQRLTTAGYTHYEISNYAQSQYQCQHNRVYWENLPYYGFGMGAASYLQRKRYTRPRTRREYSTWVEHLTEADNDLNSPPKIEANEELLETLMLGLRLAEGVNLGAIAQQFGSDKVQQLHAVLQPYQDKNWVNLGKLDHTHSESLKLTDPEGLLFSNTILAHLFSVLGEDIG